MYGLISESINVCITRVEVGLINGANANATFKLNAKA